MIDFKILRLALAAAPLLFVGCDAHKPSWIQASTVQEGDISKLWPAVAQEAKEFKMSCGEGPISDPQMYTSIRPPIHTELSCNWVGKTRKMRLYAAYSESDLLVYVPWYTTELWFSQTEGDLLVKDLETRFRQIAPTVEITSCVDECESPLPLIRKQGK